MRSLTPTENEPRTARETLPHGASPSNERLSSFSREAEATPEGRNVLLVTLCKETFLSACLLLHSSQQGLQRVEGDMVPSGLHPGCRNGVFRGPSRGRPHSLSPLVGSMPSYPHACPYCSRPNTVSQPGNSCGRQECNIKRSVNKNVFQPLIGAGVDRLRK